MDAADVKPFGLVKWIPVPSFAQESAPAELDFQALDIDPKYNHRVTYVRQLIYDGVMPSDAIGAISQRFAIDNVEALQLYTSERAKMMTETREKTTSERYIESLVFWEGIRNNTVNSLTMRMNAQKEIDKLNMTLKPAKRSVKLTKAEAEAEAEAKKILESRGFIFE